MRDLRNPTTQLPMSARERHAWWSREANNIETDLLEALADHFEIRPRSATMRVIVRRDIAALRISRRERDAAWLAFCAERGQQKEAA